MQSVTIAILTHNRVSSLMRTIESILAFTAYESFQVLVLDSGSTEESQEQMDVLSQNGVRIIHFPQVLTCAEGRNHVMGHIDTPYTVFLDDDITVAPRWLTRMMDHITQIDGCGAVAAQLAVDGLVAISGARRIENGTIQTHPFGYIGPCEICHGGATLYLTEALRKVEFRPEFSCGAEDMDMLLQMGRDHGYIIHACPVILHHCHEPVSEFEAQRWRMIDEIDSSISLFYRWGIATKAIFSACKAVQQGVGLRSDQIGAVMKIMHAYLNAGAE